MISLVVSPAISDLCRALPSLRQVSRYYVDVEVGRDLIAENPMMATIFKLLSLSLLRLLSRVLLLL